MKMVSKTEATQMFKRRGIKLCVCLSKKKNFKFQFLELFITKIVD